MKKRARLLAGAALAVLLAGLLVAPWEQPPTVEVAAGDDLQATLDAAAEGSVVLLQKGEHRGGVLVDRPLTIRGLEGASVVAPREVPAVVTVTADATIIEDVGLSGGSTGLLVREAQRVIVRDVAVTGADLHGIEVVDAAARISGARVEGLLHPMAQGIEVRNSDGRPDSYVEGSTVSGGQEGIVSHVSEVVVRDNMVSDTTMRGITITEMSDGRVEGNLVESAAGAGLYCGDMSRCQFSGNTVETVRSGDAGRSTEGWGLVVTYHAVASSEEDRLSGVAGETLASIGGHLREDSPLDPAAPLATWTPLVGAVVAALLVLLLASWVGTRLAARLGRTPARTSALIKPGGVLPLVAGGLAVQTFHMFEHGLQVFRVRVDQIPSRGGLVGPGVEAEWIHFIYNTLVLTAIGFIAIARTRGWRPPGRLQVGDKLLVAGLLVQGYHWVEHSAKLVQHLVGGAKVNPGFAGEFVDLVLFHFSINLAVYVALLGATFFYSLPILRALKKRILQEGWPGRRQARTA